MPEKGRKKPVIIYTWKGSNFGTSCFIQNPMIFSLFHQKTKKVSSSSRFGIRPWNYSAFHPHKLMKQSAKYQNSSLHVLSSSGRMPWYINLSGLMQPRPQTYPISLEWIRLSYIQLNTRHMPKVNWIQDWESSIASGERKNSLNISAEASTVQETVPVEKGSVFLTSLKVMEGEKRAGSGVSCEFMLMERFERERAKVKGS